MADLIVVGAGIMGSCCAYEAARRGQKVLLLEQFDFLHYRGSSHGESRTIRVTYPEPYYSAMVLQSFSLWAAAEKEAGYSVLTHTPHLDVGPKENQSLNLGVENCRAAGSPVSVLSAGEVAGMFSGAFSLPEGWMGVLSQGGIIKPSKAVSLFQSLAARRGALLKDRAQIVAIARDGDAIRVSTRDGRHFLGKKCAVTAGAWTRKLIEAVSGRVLPVQPLHTTICYWKIKPGHEQDFTPESGFPTFSIHADPNMYGTPSMEFPGLVKIAVHGGYNCDPDDRNWTMEEGLLEAKMVPCIRNIFQGRIEGDKPVMAQACMYSMTPDEDFIIDFLGGDFGKDVVVAGGFSGHGFKMSPLVGRILAGLAIDGEASGVDLAPFKVDRFELNPTGNAKDFADEVACLASPSSLI